MEDRETANVGVVIVGAGQAGLAVGHYLARFGTDVMLLERADSIGASWMRR
ncbi:FAD-dependent oxidoreductase [Microbacterium rhizophilus]|uniref:FAD-dependent oxidoreductase n=1 Tax=Microbacterium rhizophilus TaxID=3138934 RepID=UPI0035C9415E